MLQLWGEWLRPWLGPDVGQAALFAAAFFSATVLPGTSELALSAFLLAHPDRTCGALSIATAGNVLGGVLTYGMGRGARAGFERLRHSRIDLSSTATRSLRRHGPAALFFAFLPAVGDAMVLAAGFLQLAPLRCLAWMSAGKAARYVAIGLAVSAVPPGT